MLLLAFSLQGDVELRDEEALSFYLRAVVTFHRVREELGAVHAEKNGDGNEGGANAVSDADDELKKRAGKNFTTSFFFFRDLFSAKAQRTRETQKGNVSS